MTSSDPQQWIARQWNKIVLISSHPFDSRKVLGHLVVQWCNQMCDEVTIGNNTELVYVTRCIMVPSVKFGNEQYGILKLIAYMGEVPVEQKEHRPFHSLNESIHYS